MMNPAIKNRQLPITNGWASNSPILVAADAEAHNIAKNNPASIFFMSIYKKSQIYVTRFGIDVI
jgi:hypothetical protein